MSGGDGRDAAFPLDRLPTEAGEEWRVVPPYPAYAVSNRGRVARLAPTPRGGNGRPERLLTMNGRTGRVAVSGDPVAVYRLVAAAFPDRPAPVSPVSLSPEDAAAIRALLGHCTAEALAARFRVGPPVVRRIWRGEACADAPPMAAADALARYGPSLPPPTPGPHAERNGRRPRSLALTDEEAARLREIGGGSLSDGVRRLLAERATEGE